MSIIKSIRAELNHLQKLVAQSNIYPQDYQLRSNMTYTINHINELINKIDDNPTTYYDNEGGMGGPKNY